MTAKLAEERHRAAAERLLSDSSLRDNLTDDQAGRLIHWGLAHLKSAAWRSIDMDDEQGSLFMAQQTDAIAGVAHRINALVGRLGSQSEQTRQEYDRLIQMVRDVYPAKEINREGDRVEQTVPVWASINKSQVFDELMQILNNEV